VTSPAAKQTRVVLLIMLALLLVVGGYFVIGAARQYQADRSFHPIKIPAIEPAPAAAAAALDELVAAPAALPPATEAPQPTPAGVSSALASALAAPGLGSQVSVEVFDASTATVLLDQSGGEIVTPASTAKLLVAAAILTVHKPTDRFVTTVVAGSSPGTVVLVGGGDPTLSAAPAGQPTPCAGASRISDLAAEVKASLGGQSVTHVVVDNSVFSGPTTAPGWATDDAPSTYASPITGTMVDGGRGTPTCDPQDLRSGTPDLAAGQALAAALAGAAVSRGTAPAGAKVLGEVQSAPVIRLVEQMLTESDNVIAEVLTRQVAIAAHKPGSFADGAAAVSAALRPLGIEVGSGMKDGSGLSSQDRLPAKALASVLLKAFDPQHLQLRPIVAGLSVAGWDGTLLEQHRFSAANRAYGVVRAKTGSLPAAGVHALAGIVTDVDGRPLVFAFVADHAAAEDSARVALDNLAATLAGCGCR
jgi:D-alanyl-D-alanine carboxypeptidase/D-alanyl-D-alanine-endopeptidase (penicillin-binding protein 4)